MPSMNQLYQDELAHLYDAAVPDWEGEIDLYRNLARQDVGNSQSILEVACGTGRVAIKLAEAGFHVVGIDLSDDMLDIARRKSTSLSNVSWAKADMRSFHLDQQFAMALLPAYSFQLLLTEDDQEACLRSISKHLLAGARLILHLEQHDPDWLASLPVGDYTPFETSGETSHPHTGDLIRVSYAWSRSPATQSVAVRIRYETIDPSGVVTRRAEREPLRMACTSSEQLESLLVRSRFEIEEYRSDFICDSFDSTSDEMIVVLRNRS